jgi:shikimate kinase
LQSGAPFKEPEDRLRYLILLRGPAGVGKSAIRKHLRRQFERLFGVGRVCLLDLDQVNSDRFEENMKQALTSTCVLGEMFYGNSHTTHPHSWMDRLKGYQRVSFVLEASAQPCFRRIVHRYEDPHYPNLDSYKERVYEAHVKERNEFPKKAGIVEHRMDTEKSTEEETARTIGEMVLSSKD